MLDNQSSTITVSEVTSSRPKVEWSEIIAIGLLVSAVVFAPGILVALILLPILRKNKKK